MGDSRVTIASKQRNYSVSVAHFEGESRPYACICILCGSHIRSAIFTFTALYAITFTLHYLSKNYECLTLLSPIF